MTEVRTVPARSPRPANRRDLILDAATDLFTGRGFAHVSMSDIAARVEVRPSALYRHFPGKDGLLEATVLRALDSLGEVLTGADIEAVPLEGTLRRVAAFGAEHRSRVLLWEREARHLPPTSAVTGTRLGEVRAAFSRAVTAEGAAGPAQELAARMALGALLSPGFHRAPVNGAAHQQVLVDTAAALLDAGGDAATSVGAGTSPPTGGLVRATKREQILQAAQRIFAEQTYASAGMEQIAAAVGMTASSLYNHFSSKAEILQVSMRRGNGYLQVTLDDVLHESADEAAALRGLVGVYGSFALRHPGLVDALLTEVGSLGDDAGTLVQAQREYVGEWVRLLHAARPDLSAGEGVLVVQGVLGALNEVTRDPRLRDLPGAAELVPALATAGLRLPDDGTRVTGRA